MDKTIICNLEGTNYGSNSPPRPIITNEVQLVGYIIITITSCKYECEYQMKALAVQSYSVMYTTRVITVYW